MWIRSQDKKILKKAKMIWSNKTSSTYYGDKRFLVQCDEEILLGQYSTEEKALKVLDMIQSAIQRGKLSRHSNEYIEENINVFQMPQDEEV